MFEPLRFDDRSEPFLQKAKLRGNQEQSRNGTMTAAHDGSSSDQGIDPIVRST